jgi:hypothetical protein
MKEEYNSLVENNIWELVPLPSNGRLVICKWILKTNRATYGYVTKYKAQLVSKGFSHVQSIDCEDTFASVTKIDSIRLVLAIAGSRKWEVHYMDVNNALLHGDINDKIYMEHPYGYVWVPSLVCSLRKSLYELK